MLKKCERYTLPTQAGKKLTLGQLFTDAARAVECTDIVSRYPGPVLLITTNMQNALQLHNEIRQLTTYPVLILPDWETLPYDNFSPHKEIISERIATLSQLPKLTRGVIVLPINTLMQRICPQAFVQSHTLLMTKGQRLSQQMLRVQLEQAGYRYVYQVMEHGEFATSGSGTGTLIDLYAMGSVKPYRINFLHDKIHSLCMFDVDTQCTLQEVTSITLLPAHEFPTDKVAIELFRRQWRAQFDVPRDAEQVDQQVSQGILPPGIEYWQPLFFNEPLVSLFSYLPAGTLVVNTGDLAAGAGRFWDYVSTRFVKNCYVDPRRPLLPPQTLWLQVPDLFFELQHWPWVQFSTQILLATMGHQNIDYQPLPNVALEAQSKDPMEKFCRFYEQFNGTVIFSAENPGRRETVSQLLAQVKIFPKRISLLEEATEYGAYIIIGASKRGFIDATRSRVLICESDLLGEQFSRSRQDNLRTMNTDTLIRNLVELHEGQPVVHLEHGVGRYAGMITLEVGGIKAEYLIITYAGNDKLYVPVYSLNIVNRYTGGTDETAPLHKLGGNAWARARQKAAERVRDIAAEILDIYAQRAVKRGFSFRNNLENYQLFCEEFPFEPTVDQMQAIHAVINDMCQPLTMDRLVCGDVGFGKTEVAMRAAFLAIENHKQVVVLVPTTLLAQQHFDTFRDRFANWPVHIEMLSRFRSVRDQTFVLEQIAEGKVDILIGTHKLLQSNIQWHDLGLLIVDEEHRFGVRHKESIKAMRADVDILTLTATPIPRTLNMAMSGLRNLSIIATPPPRRLAVKTFVREYDALVVRDAILRETLRGGQVYYLYNDVKNIEQTARRLKRLVPEARIAISHGQLCKNDLEQVMNDFHHQRCNVLVCTTIIETGIDIASANTIIIERANNLGLAQLHQLRGRVGRSHHQAYAYFLTPPPQSLSQDADKRLAAIASMEALGSGFALAIHDSEIRGNGELLGANQSGQMETVGFALYMELLGNAVNALNTGREPSFDDLTKQLTEVELRIPALLPEDYIPDVNTRLSLYKRIASAVADYEIEDLHIELINRFGLLPNQTRYLLAIARLRQRAQRLGIRRIQGSDKGGLIEFNETNNVDPAYIIDLLTHEPGTYRLDGPTRLRFIGDLADRTVRLNYVESLLAALQQHTLN